MFDVFKKGASNNLLNIEYGKFLFKFKLMKIMFLQMSMSDFNQFKEYNWAIYWQIADAKEKILEKISFQIFSDIQITI